MKSEIIIPVIYKIWNGIFIDENEMIKLLKEEINKLKNELEVIKNESSNEKDP